MFDAKKAAVRFIKYLDLIDEVFGSDVLYRPPHPIPRLSDFTKEDMSALKLGYYQLLPYRDRAGRRMLSNFFEVANSGNAIMTDRSRVSVFIIFFTNYYCKYKRAK